MANIKILKDVSDEEVEAGRVYIDTYLGQRKVVGINRDTWWVTTGKELDSRSFSLHPGANVVVKPN